MKAGNPIIWFLSWVLIAFASHAFTRTYYVTRQQGKMENDYELTGYKISGFNIHVDKFIESSKKVQNFNASGQRDSALYYYGQMAAWLECEKYFMADTTKKK